MRAVQIEEFGGPEVLQLVDLPKPSPGEGEVLIEVTRAGMNFADTHQRENSYLSRYEVPLVLGGEVAGTTRDGRRVVALLRSGGYAEYAVAPEATVFPIPDGLDEGTALALLIQGLTAWHLFRTSAKLAETGRLMRKSRAVVGFWLMHCLGRRDMMEEPLADLFERAARGELRPQLGETYPLSEVRRAHEDLQGRRTTGKLLLDPSR